MIDPDASRRLRLNACLEQAGFAVIEAVCPDDGVLAVRDLRLSAVLLSPGPAGADGIASCSALKSDPETAAVPVLLLARDASTPPYADAVQAGAEAWLSEPVEPSVLLRTLRALLARPPVNQGRPPAGRPPAEATPVESEEHFRSLFENATVGLYRTTPDGLILMANPALVSMLGFDSFEELRGRNLELEGMGPGVSRAAFRRQIETEGTVRDLEVSWIRSDGTPLFIRESARVVRGADGAVRFYDGIVEDFTRRKQAEDTLRESEQRFRAVFDQAAVGIVQATMEGRFLAVNDRFCEIVGYSRDELLRMSYIDITHPGDLLPEQEIALQFAAGKITSFKVEKRYVCRDGGTVWAKLFVSRVNTGLGSPDMVVGVVEDISEQKRAEEELRKELQFDGAMADTLMRLASCSGSEIDEAINESLAAAVSYFGADRMLVVVGSSDRAAPWYRYEWPAHERVGANGSPYLLEVPIKGRRGGDGSVAGRIALYRNAQPWSQTDLTRLRIISNALAVVLERKGAEESLRQSEEKFSLVFHANPEAILITSVSDQRITDLNSRFCAVSGYDRDEVIGKTTEDLGLFVNPAQRAQIWSELVAHGAVSDLDLQLRDKHGAIRSGLLSSVVVKVAGDPCLISIFRDLTRRRQAEEALRRQAAFDNLMAGLLAEFVRCGAAELEGAVENAMAAIAGFFEADHVLQFELSATHRWQVTREWCAAHVFPVRTGNQHRRLWECDRLAEDRTIFLDLASPAETDRLHVENYRAEGATVVLNVPIKGAAGVVTGRIGLHRHGGRTPWTPEDAARLRLAGHAIGNALERKRAEETLRESEARFRDLADSAPLITWMSGPDKHVVYFSRPASEFFGQPTSLLTGNLWMAFLHPEDRDKYAETAFGGADRREPFSLEARFRRADGEYRWFLVTGIPRVVDGVYQGHIGTGVDITDLKHGFERSLAHQKLQSLGILAAGIAHDFNNLLGAIIARAESAEIEMEPESPATGDVHQIRLTALRAAEIVSQLMAYARQESAPSTAVDLSELVAEMLDLLSVSIAKSAVLKAELAPDLPAIRANPSELRQMVMNLILNSSEALGGKPGSIVIETSLAPATAGAPRSVRLVVADTGCGMTAEVMAKIFDPFFSTRFAGRGLGLSALQGIMRRHGGTVQVESTPGAGSRFILQFPCPK